MVSRSDLYLPINIGHLSSEYHPHDFSFHIHALKRRPLWLGELHVLWNSPLLLQVHLKNSSIILKSENILIF